MENFEFLGISAERMNMEYCINHPDRETSFVCLKHNIYMCEECLQCRDPQLYCKFRSSCPIHFLTKRKGNLDDVNPPEDKNLAEGVRIANIE